MKIVHFSITPLAGGPYRLVSLLKNNKNLEVNLIDLHRWGRYPNDIIYDEEMERAQEIAYNADIIHFHNYYDQNSRFFKKIDFKMLKKKGVSFICQFRSEPKIIAHNGKTDIKTILSYDIPTIVIAQYVERFFPKARVIPNAVPSNDTLYMPGNEENIYEILFSPTKKIGGWEDRWNTKGAPETIKIMEKIKQKKKIKLKIISGRPLSEVLIEKKRALIVLDDMVTGSYHVSGLEAACQAKAVLTYLDDRVSHCLREITGTSTIPFINVRLEDSYKVLNHLLENQDIALEIGREARKWIDNYWSEGIITDHYLDVYKNLLESPSLVSRQQSLMLNRKTQNFHSLILPDIIYSSRGTNYYNSLSLSSKIHYKISRFLRKETKALATLSKNNLPKSIILFLKNINSLIKAVLKI
ncbi:hypothetical protein [Desulfotignum balticum]|uniref:hypothetical protein n=1 Tax=Desulfotignum balticum TaxID=115781 RepID=UPI000417F16E|nr:hypothetical protein [Desulfotignum balticum]